MKGASDDLFERRWIVDVHTYVVIQSTVHVLVGAHCGGSFSSTISTVKAGTQKQNGRKDQLGT